MIAAWRGSAFLADFSSTFASRLVGKFLMAFVVALAARRLGPHVFGIYVAITTYIAMAGSVVDFGLAPYVTRTISEGNPIWRPLWVSAAIRTVLGLFLAGAGVVASFWVHIDLPTVPVVCVAATMFTDLLTDLLLAALRGRGHFHSIARTTVVRSVVSVAASSVFVFGNADLSMLTMAFLAASLAGLGYTARQARILLTSGEALLEKASHSSGIAGLRAALPAIWGFALSGILCGAYMRVGPAVLARSGPAEVGIYGAAYKVIEAGLFAGSIVCSILIPYLSAAHSASRAQFQHMVEASMRLMVLPAFLAANLVIVIADPLISLIYGARYAGAGTVLEILGVFFLLIAITGGVQSAVLIAMGELKFASLLTGAALVIAVPLNFYMTPRYGAAGSALANCIGEGLVLGGNLWLLRRRGLPGQTRLTVVCLALTVGGVVAQHLPWPISVMAPLAYGVAFGWKCLEDLRWSVGTLSQGRSLTAASRGANRDGALEEIGAVGGAGMCSYESFRERRRNKC
jgi:O-antigen/teichoic acid export membrane protein